MAEDKFKFTIHFPTTYDSSGLDAMQRDMETAKQAAEEVDQANPMAMTEEQLGPKREEVEILQEKEEQVEKVTKAVEKVVAVTEEERRAQAAADVERVRAMKNQQRQSEMLKRLAENSQRLIAVGLGQTLNDVAGAMRGVNKQQDLMADGLSTFAAGLQTGNPYVAISASAVAAGKAIYQAFKEAEKVEKAVKKQAEDTEKRLKRFYEERANLAKDTAVLESFKAENEAIYDQITALELAAELMQSRVDAAEAMREANQQIAKIQGANPDEISAADRSGDAAAQRAALQKEIDDAIAVAEAKDELESAANADARYKKGRTSGFDQQAIDEAKANAAAMEKEAVAAWQHVAHLTAQLPDRLEELTAGMQTRIAEETRVLSERQRDNVTEALSEVEGLVGQHVKDRALALQEALKQAGTIVDARESGLISQRMEQLRDAAALEDSKMLEAISDNVELSRSMTVNIRSLSGEVQRLRRDNEDLRQMIMNR